MARFDPEIHGRRSIRLAGYDYAQAGAYFVTLCTQGRTCLFGDVVDGEMRLNEYGKIAHDEWCRSAEIRAEIALDEWIVMPNHLHGIVVIRNSAGGATGRSPLRKAGLRGPAKRSLGALIAGFKSAAAKRINRLRGTRGMSVWQRNYYEHIIRNEKALTAIRRYIQDNPQAWAYDQDNLRAPRLSRDAADCILVGHRGTHSYR